MVEARGGVVFIYHVDVAESWRHGAAGSRQRMCQDELARDGCNIWRHGGVDASLVRGFASIFQPGVGSADRAVEVTSEACAQGAFFGYHQGVRDDDGRGTKP
jgi:hypothetical protein